MKISEQWLRAWVDPPVAIEQLAEQLTMAGLEVEAIENFSVAFSGIVVARVQSVAAHPASEKLHLCKVDAGGGEILDIVCGADNVRAGMQVALARIGAMLPGDKAIQATAIRGIDSQGMLCSAVELGLAEEAEGILELPAGLEAGRELQDILTARDNVLEISLTPNRGDCLSVAGIAREVAVLNHCPLKTPDIKPVKAGHDNKRTVGLDAAGACPHYVGRIIENIDNTGVVPLWLSERLQRSGIRTINPVVDITNYVMLELGQPMHAFADDKLEGDIHVRYAKPGEKLMLLDQQECELAENVLVIADDGNVLAMAGVMGGLDSAVTGQTKTIFLESAYFDPLVIGGQARHYGFHTDSSHRFERGVDYTLQKPAIERATQLILEICGGIPGPVIEASAPDSLPERPPVRLHDKEIERLLGITIPPEQVTSILESLGMRVSGKKERWDVTPPARRFDIAIEADLIEELARVHGYDNIPAQNPRAAMHFHDGHREYAQLRKIRTVLAQRGYQEAITYSFVDKKLQDLLAPETEGIELANPIAADMSVMRTSTWPGLLQALLYNLNRQQPRVRLFETGLVYWKIGGKIRQEPVVGGIIYGNTFDKQWDRTNSLCDYFDIKGDVEEILRTGGMTAEIEFRPEEQAALHPGQSARIVYANQAIGTVGALHPAIQSTLGLAQQTYIFELDVRGISRQITPKYRKISKFPMVKRDLAIVVDENITLHRVMNCIRKSGTASLINLELFDVYRGEGIDLGKKSLALGLTFQGSSSTLTDEEVETTIGEVLSSLRTELGGTLRE